MPIILSIRAMRFRGMTGENGRWVSRAEAGLLISELVDAILNVYGLRAAKWSRAAPSLDAICDDAPHRHEEQRR